MKPINNEIRSIYVVSLVYAIFTALQLCKQARSCYLRICPSVLRSVYRLWQNESIYWKKVHLYPI